MSARVCVSCLRSLYVAGIIAVMPFLTTHVATAQTDSANEWIWESGSSTTNAPGVYGTLGTAAATNLPGGRTSAVSWTDSSGNLWLFGGDGYDSTGTPGYLNDLWEFSSATKEWTWESGANSVGSPFAVVPGVYGTLGVAATSNVPSGRESAVTWTDSSGNLWLFGGVGFDATGAFRSLNDLWEFNPSNKEWTWMSGSSSTGGVAGVYGTLGVAATGNVPGARQSAATWTDSSGNLWLFGGYGVDSTGITGSLNDLWEFSPTAKTWVWESGSNMRDVFGVYGTLGVAATTNVPAARAFGVSWIDSSGNLWLFGGNDIDFNTMQGYLNDLWEFSPATKKWTWMSGTDSLGSTGVSGVYGTLGVASTSNVPGSRASAVSWIDSSGKLWLFGGYGFDSTGTQRGLNDLWEFTPATKEWTWVSGANSVGTGGGVFGVYGTLGVAAATNVPGGRYSAVSWADSSGNLWLFGGGGFASTGAQGGLNDLWKYQLPTTTPMVTVTPSLTSITTIQGLTVTVAVSTGSGSRTATGSVVLTGGGYTSSSTTLSSGSATINIPAGSLAAGTDTLTATYTPDSASALIYATASGSNSVIVLASATTLTLSTNPTSSTYGQQVVLVATLSPYSVQSISTNGEPVTFYNGSSSLGTGTLSSGVTTLNVTALPVGTDSLKAVYAGDANFTTSTSNTLPFTVSLAAPTITFTVPNHTYGDAPFTVSATSNSVGAITYSVVSGPATITGSTVTLTGAGSVVLQASQVAAGNYTAGTQTATVTVAKESQTITFAAPISPVTYGVAPITLSASSTSGLAVTFSVVSGPGTVSGSTLTITGVGTVVVAANQAGNTNYASATQVTQSIVVNVIGAAATPIFSPVADTYTAAQTVSISDTTPGATIYYTTNGTTPTTSSTVYNGAISISSTETLEAIATATGYSTSAVATAAYTIANPLPAISGVSPAFTNAGGTLFTLTVNGSGFIATSTVYWGASALTTTYVSATQLTAQVPAADIAAVGTIAITVQTPAPGGGTSNAWQFEVDTTTTGTGPTITSTTATVTAGSTASYPVTMPASVTSVSVTCLNLPTGATCSYSSTTNSVTITTSPSTPKGTYQIIVVFTETVTSAAFLLPILLLPLGFMRRKLAARGIWLTACLGLVLLATAALSIGCGWGGGSGSTTPPPTQQVTSSGSVSLTIQ